ncbi:hypothetical protein BGW39_011768 [Mortierella sp. 14UC]|nr:hypothetical protein BGW39_011768 [Mortierella sp. 14UC]
MDSLDRFFGIPELASVVASYLHKDDISDLMLTCRLMHAAMTPSFYYKVNVMSYNSIRTNLWESPEGLKALARNIGNVNVCVSGLSFLVYYYHATAAFYDNGDNHRGDNDSNTSYSVSNDNSGDNSGNDSTNCNNNDSTTPIYAADVSCPATALLTSQAATTSLLPQPTATSPAIPHQFSPETINSIQLIPLSAMSGLKKLELVLARSFSEHDCHYFLANYSNSRATIARLCRVLDLLPQLQELGLCNVLVRDSGSAQLLGSKLQDMVKLKRITISFSHRRPFPGIATMFFFSCPPSVEYLNIGQSDPGMKYETHDDMKDGNDESDGSGGQVGHGMARRTVALSNLRTLVLVEWFEDPSKEDFLSIIKHCPRLEKLEMDEVMAPVGVHGADIGRLCPKLCDIYYYGSFKEKRKNAWPFETMETLPENRMEKLDVTSPSDYCLDEIGVGRTLLRHSCTLRVIKFDTTVASVALGMILHECEALELLYTANTTIDLDDAVAYPWASSRMTHLSLEIQISPPLSTPGTLYIPYYFRTPPDQPSADDHGIFARLENFYRQIGKQKDIRILDINWTESIRAVP